MVNQNNIANTIAAYHGSGVSIEVFDYKFTDRGNDQLGSGFYFTTRESEAEAYCFSTLNQQPKLGGDDNPTLHQVVLTFKKCILVGEKLQFKKHEVAEIIRSSPVLNEQLESYWGDVEFYGTERLIRDAIEAYDYDEEVDIIRFLNQISKDFYPGHTMAFFTKINQMYGYDGVHMSFDEHDHYVAWFPNQIEITDRRHLSSSARLKLKR